MKMKWPVKRSGSQRQSGSSRVGSYRRLSRSFFYRLYFVSNRTGRYALRIAGLIADSFHLLWNMTFSELFNAVREKARRIAGVRMTPFGRGDFSVAKSMIRTVGSLAGLGAQVRREAAENGFRSGVSGFFRIFSRAFRSFWKSHKRVFNYVAPVFGIAVLTGTVLFWSGRHFALKVMYNGKFVGYIASEQTFCDAVNSVETNVRNASGQLFQLKYTPSFQLAMVKESQLTVEGQLTEKIILSSGSQVAQGYGLYVDGKLVGVNSSDADIRQMLNGVLDSYKTGAKDETVSFMQDVSVKSGVFPQETTVTVAEMKNRLLKGNEKKKTYVAKKGDSVMTISNELDVPLATLYDLNPVIASTKLAEGQTLVVEASEPLVNVEITRTEQYTRSVSYGTKKVSTKSLYKKQTKVKSKGKDGKALVTAKVTYIDGKVSSKTVVNTKIVKDPVDKVVLVGEKSRPATVASGHFLWPIRIGVGYISSPFGGLRHHSGIDIACNQGTPIKAADGGTVEFAGWYSGYGNCVIIRHSGSLETLYGHSSKLLVSKGAKVYKGQVIALVGHTGHVIGRTGNHLHFEVRVNGKAVNPIRFLP